MTQQTGTDIRPGTYRIDPAHSAVRFTAAHTFGLKPVDGAFTVRAGTVMVAAEPRRSTVSAELEAASFTTDDERRNKDVRGRRFLDVQRWPVIGFRSTRLARGERGWQVVGELSARGGSGEATFDVTEIIAAAGGYRISATGVVDRVAAGVSAGRAVIGRYVQVSITVQVVPGTP